MTNETRVCEQAADEAELQSSASLKRLFALIRPFLPQLAGITLMMLAVTALIMAIPEATGHIIDSALDADVSAKLTPIALGLLVLIAGMCALKFLASYWLSHVGAKFLLGLRERVFAHLLGLSLNFFQKRQVGELNARIMANLETIQNLITTDILIGSQAFIRLIGIIVILLAMNYQLTLVALVVNVPVILASLLYGKHLERAALRKNDALAESSAVVEETLSGIATVQAFGRERQESRRYGSLLQRLFGRQMAEAGLRSSYLSVTDLFGLSALVGVVWFGGRLIVAGELTVGELSACMMYMAIFATSIEDVGNLFTSLKELTGISHRFFQILDEVPLVPNRGTVVAEKHGDVTLEFDRVSFAYPSSPAVNVIDSLSLEIKAGEVVALVGPSGSGKSTVFKLLMRFYDAGSGTVRVGGKPVAEYEVDSLRNLYGLVSQDIFLFSGTILDNIRYGNSDATLDEVMAALEAVGAADFVTGFEHGLHQQVGVVGTRLSGGQKQRLGLARMYLKNPRVLLLDEATSALDSESEARVQAGLRKLKQGRTTLVIAHRLSTVREASRILMIEKGRIVAAGDHDYLQRHSSLYGKYWQWQSRGAEAPAPVEIAR